MASSPPLRVVGGGGHGAEAIKLSHLLMGSTHHLSDVQELLEGLICNL